MKRIHIAAVIGIILLLCFAACAEMLGMPPGGTEETPAVPSGASKGSVASDKKEEPEDTAPPEAPPPEKQKPETPETPQPAREDFARLAPTTAMTFEELVGDNGDYAKFDDYPPADTYKIVVNVYYQVITAYKKDEKGEHTVPARYMICSTGSHELPTPTGTFKMGRSRNRFSKFVSYGVYGQYWSQITRSIYFHSLLYKAKNARTYTASSYRNLGRRASHGCIRLLVPDARWIYYNAAPGTAVEIVRGKKDEEMAAVRKKLTRPALPDKRPALEKGEIPVTEPWPGYTWPATR